jgi:hypothetical protein
MLAVHSQIVPQVRPAKYRHRLPVGVSAKLVPMGTVKRVAPIFVVRDLDAAMAPSQRLGFATRVFEDGGYGFATRDGIEFHLGSCPTRTAGPARRTSGLRMRMSSRRHAAPLA